MQVIINKTQLYRLVAEYVFLPKRHDTHFEKSLDKQNNFLTWTTDNGQSYRASFSVEGNYPTLRITTGGNGKSNNEDMVIHWKNISDLISLGVIRGARNEQQWNKFMQLNTEKAIFVE